MINLLPDQIKKERMYGRRNRTLLTYNIALISTAGVIAAIMVGSLQFVGADEAQLREEIESANVKVQALESNVKEIEKVAQRLETAKKLSDLSVQFSDLIPQIGAVLPEGVVLNALSLTGGVTDPLLLDVDIATADLAPVLSRNLVESELFEAADIATLAPKGSGDTTEEAAPTEIYKFSASLNASFTGSAEAKRKQAAQEAAQAEAAAQLQKEDQ